MFCVSVRGRLPSAVRRWRVPHVFTEKQKAAEEFFMWRERPKMTLKNISKCEYQNSSLRAALCDRSDTDNTFINQHEALESLPGTFLQLWMFV